MCNNAPVRRYVNIFIIIIIKMGQRSTSQVPLKMNSPGMMRNLPWKNDWMASIDLKDTYLSVTIWEGHHNYLRFSWFNEEEPVECVSTGT